MWGWRLLVQPLAPAMRRCAPSLAAALRPLSSAASAAGGAADAAPAAAPPLPDPSRPLRLFVCAADEESDGAVAQVVGALRRQHAGGVRVDGVGGPALLAQGLRSVWDEPWFRECEMLEATSGAPPYISKKIHPLDDAPVPSATATVQRQTRAIAAALFGAGDGPWNARGATGAAAAGAGDEAGARRQQPTQQQQEQEQGEQQAQQQQHSTPQKQQQQHFAQQQQPGSPPHNNPQQQPQPQRGAPYDALLIAGGRRLGRELLKGCRVAQDDYGAAGVPPRIVYLPRDVADPRSAADASKAWGELADHVMCATAAEAAAVAKAGGAPASAVGHPASALLGARGGGGGGARGGRPAAGAARVEWLKARAAEAAALAAPGGGGGGGSAAGGGGVSFVAGSPERFWRAFGGGGGRGADDEGRPLVALLPGCYEAHLTANLGVYDSIVSSLHESNPSGVRAVILVPRVWVNEVGDAARSFGVRPLAVLPLGTQDGWDALAAAAAALADCGEASLHAVLAGAPLVCASAVGPLADGLPLRRGLKALGGAGCAPNLLAGRRVVSEHHLWGGYGRGKVVAELARLLEDEGARKEQREGLRAAAGALAPPPPPAGRGRGAAGAAGAAGGTSAADAAAAVVLQLIEQRRREVAARR